MDIRIQMIEELSSKKLLCPKGADVFTNFEDYASNPRYFCIIQRFSIQLLTYHNIINNEKKLNSRQHGDY
jgi:hypothetical protein